MALFLYASLLFSQPGKLNLRFAPLALGDIYSGACIRGGAEIKVIENWSVSLEAGHYLNNFNGMKQIKGILTDLMVRRYFSSLDSASQIYFSINYTFKKQSFNYHDSILTILPYFVGYQTRKLINCINLNIGYYKVLKKRILLDAYAGVGIRMKVVDSTLTDSEFDKAKEYNDSQSLYFMVTPGKFFWPNLNLGIRVGYVIY